MNTKRRSAAAIALVAVLGIAGAVVAAPGEDEGILGETRTILEKWVENRRLIAKESRDWELGREVLESRIGLQQDSIDSLRASLDELKKSLAAVEKKEQELLAKQEKLQKAQQLLEPIIRDLESRVSTLVDRLPTTIENVATFAEQIPKAGDESKLTLSKRFQNVVAVLLAVDKFNKDIHVSNEVITLDGGDAAQVDTVYVGIAQRYYVTKDGKKGGVGTLTSEGWTWEPTDDAGAKAIAKVVGIVRDGDPAEFVPLPIRLDDEQETE